MSDNKNLGAPSTGILAPSLAYGHTDVYHQGHNTAPLPDVEYGEYKFLGTIPVWEGDHTYEAREMAQAKFGPEAKVFRTARFWIAYTIR